MNYQENYDYLAALKEASKYHKNPEGLLDYEGVGQSDKYSFRQRNTIIILLLLLHKKFNNYNRDLLSIKETLDDIVRGKKQGTLDSNLLKELKNHNLRESSLKIGKNPLTYYSG